MSDMTRSEAIDVIELIMRKYEEDECICCDITLGDEEYEALRLARDSLKTDEAYQLEYESTTKNELPHCQHTKECLNKIAKLTEELDIADVTKEEALEALKDASFNEISEELWRYYCFVCDIKGALIEVGKWE